MNYSKGKPPEITYLAPLITEHRKKRCSCKDRKFLIDLTNRTIECSVCGQFIDPFDAMVEIANKNERYDNYLKSQRNFAVELNNWFERHREPIALKTFIENYRHCDFAMLPYCPNCGEMFDINDIKMWGNKKFLKRKGNQNV